MRTCLRKIQTAIAPFEAALASNPEDPAALVGLADLFENSNLPANAAEIYTRLRKLWPDAVWVKSKLFDLQQKVATAAAAAAPSCGRANIRAADWHLEIQKSRVVAPIRGRRRFGSRKPARSPRGGGITPDNMLLLTDEKATLAAIRLGFQDFLKRRAGKNDTVVILVASHGTVEVPGSRSAFILTYDSDPQDLKSTALPMTELKSLFEQQLSKVGRVVIFADVCKASKIGSIQSTTVNSDVQRLQDAEGQLLG